MCKTCSPPVSIKSRVSERQVEWYLKSWAEQGKIPMYTSWDKRITGINTTFCNGRRPDFLYDMDNWILVLEVDEHAHAGNNGRCEFTRIQDITNAVGMIPVYVCRYNPHAFKVSGVTRRMGITERTNILLKNIQEIISNPPVENHITIRYLLYGCDQCKLSRFCSYVHTDKFRTMVDFGNYVESEYPLSEMGSEKGKPKPSANAEHPTRK
jgi:hypothetical protein